MRNKDCEIHSRNRAAVFGNKWPALAGNYFFGESRSYCIRVCFVFKLIFSFFRRAYCICPLLESGASRSNKAADFYMVHYMIFCGKFIWRIISLQTTIDLSACGTTKALPIGRAFRSIFLQPFSLSRFEVSLHSLSRKLQCLPAHSLTSTLTDTRRCLPCVIIISKLKIRK